jgi:hypothetical protein
MWKVKRKMNTARIVVLTIAVCAGGADAYAARGSSPKQVEVSVAMDTPIVLAARSDIALGHTATLESKPEQAAATLSLALRDPVEASNNDVTTNEAGKRDSVNVGVSTTMTTRK